MNPFQAMAQAGGQQAQGVGNQFMGQAGQIQQPLFGAMIPQIQSGMTPQDMNNMLVAGQQESGGALSSIQGLAEQRGLASRNTGTLGLAVGQAARQKMAQDTQTALNVQNERLRRQMQAEQLGAGVMGQQYGDALRAMGLIPEDVKAGAAARTPSFLQTLAQGLGQGMGAGLTKV